MASVRDADNCIKYLDRSVLDDRAITVERVHSWKFSAVRFLYIFLFLLIFAILCCLLGFLNNNLLLLLLFFLFVHDLFLTVLIILQSKRCRRRKPTPGKYLGPERG
jgi:hypothetical protein